MLQYFGCLQTILCAQHSPKSGGEYEGQLRSLIVKRRVYVNRDEDRQIASVLTPEEKRHCIRVGSLVIQNVGQLVPYQMQTGRFNSRDFLYPVGYKATRYHWSFRRLNKRCKYVCRINDIDGWPEFTITVIEDGLDKMTFRDNNPTGAWKKVMKRVEMEREEKDVMNFYTQHLIGDVLFGLNEPVLLRVLGLKTFINILHTILIFFVF